MSLNVLVHFGYVISNLYHAELRVRLMFAFGVALGDPDKDINRTQETN